ncbi:shikimate dehydrogenase [Dysgonomonas sp. 520]|uniref:shikimate dehydrogenase family protein n=1 Tax=Dysgonomonas sp. 520 TaxID=2302931 RepID=UPI0013D40A6A|nr:shikimate dehydrogenase [Dysgonomonas sp. 520]NDW10377.1 shikimate dehydrogenase [Dysgonomonas sp. 520]
MAKDTYGLVGYPIKLSFSRGYFSEKFEKENINAEYLNFEIADISEFPDIVSKHPNLKGMNVTIPYKEKIIPYLDSLDPNAAQIGAVNVIKVIKKEGQSNPELIGYNSDMIGFQKSIEPLINKAIHRKALILGTGGASKAVAQGLTNLGLEYKYVSRTKNSDNFTYNELNRDRVDEYTVIVNATPIGASYDPDKCPHIPYQYLSDRHLLYDLIYNPAETKFLRLGKEKGTITKNGAEMLVLQAEAAWKIWNK